MKKHITLFLIAALIVGCEDNTELTSVKNGVYSGFFYYQGIHYYSSISIDNSYYAEGASGGVIFQKNFSTLTQGTFMTYQNIITFNSTGFKMKESSYMERNPDLVLNGTFRIVFIQRDSISFERGTGERKIVYLLRRYTGED